MATAAPEPSTSTAPPPPALNAGSAKVQRIVDDIAALTLLEAADLVSQLKTRLNIQEIAMPAASAGPAAVAAAPVEAAEEEKPKEKTIFSVKLEKFDAASKAKIIKEIKAIVPNMNLVEAKKFVESAPKVIKENVPKEEAEKLKKTFTDLGATIVLE
ncbi:ClpS-like protein [Dacryopinax primogenitus]|uniref:ClpS-like protein n=1 Tax=Dacryopinax primogenitus (strain DJM 731) TaxID=1858805 RepID=M5FWG4_DACPD|nr:ClpS-like protein [Dacryopinax primogenitus]EJT97741.1 ClpS-like protein [Dacryopinax primogenitus]